MSPLLGHAAAFTAGDVAVLQAAASANNTTASVLELNTSTANQTSPVQTIAISGTDAVNAIRISGSATSTGYVSHTDDNSLLTFTGVNNTNTSSNANTLNPRAVVTLDASGNTSIATTYTGSSGNQTRSATALNNSTWFIADQGGIYTNTASGASPSGNFRSIKAFGGTVYVGQASSTSTTIQVATASAASGGTVTGLPGLTNNANLQDFYLIKSGDNGNIYDVLYTVSATSNAAGTIAKYSLVSGSWTANGSYTTTFGGFGLAAADNGVGAVLYVTTGQGALTANKLMKLSDTAGYNSAISITTADNVTLYTAATGTILKGVDFAPAAAGSSNTAPTIALNTTATTNFLDGGATTAPTSGAFSISGVINDATDPATTLGLTFTVNDAETAAASLTVTASSSNTSVVPNGNLVMSGTGSDRSLKITPAGVGYTDITVTVSDGSTSNTYVIAYAASATGNAASRFLTGAGNASTAIAIDSNYMLVGDDENQVLRLYDRSNSGLPVNGFDYTASLGLTQTNGSGVLREMDIEASAKVGSRIYWMGSQSNNDTGTARPNRNRVFATDMSGTGATTTLSYVGRYDFLKEDLIAWDQNNGHGKGANYYGLAASAAAGVGSKQADGYNIEGLEFAPDNSTAYVAFRAPQIAPANRTKALIVPVTNFTALLGGSQGSASFGAPIELDLGGRGIREIRKNANNQYVIIAGPAGDATGTAPSDFRLYTWTGNANDAPALHTANLTSLSADGSFESIVEVPNPLITTSPLQLLLDQGTVVFYNDGVAGSDLTVPNFQKSRSEWATLGAADTGVALPVVSLSAVDANAAETSQVPGKFRISRTGDTTADLTVNYTVSGTAASTDYPETLSGSVTIPAGQSSVDISITPVDDALFEGDETVILTLATRANYTQGATTSATVTIADNDTAPTVNLSVSSTSGSETGQTVITVTATASAAVNGAQTVNLGVSGVTAGDYTLSNTVITLASGQTAGSVTFTVVDDSVVESTETAVLTLSSPSSGIVLGATTSQNISITDNDVACSATDTPIGTVQGSGASAALTGTRTIQGVVVGDYEGASSLSGFYVQDAGDSDATTSDGIFVFNGSNNSVSVGQVVQVTGTVTEFQGLTEITSPSIEECGTTGSITPTQINLPFPAAVSGVDFLERYEGMLVSFPQTLYVTEHFQLSRFGQVTLSAGARLSQPTNVALPGTPALTQQALNDRNQFIVDDDLQTQNPDPIKFGRGGNPLSASNTLRGGDTIANLTGVLTYTWSGNAASGNAWRLRPINALGVASLPNFQAGNPRPTVPAQVNGSLKVASSNLLNFFNTFTNCITGLNDTTPSTSDCRGAENQAEFDRQWPKTVANLTNNGADVIVINEMENDGYGANSAIQFLVDKMNIAAGAGTYAFINPDAATSTTDSMGSDAIKVGIIYKPSTVTPVGTTAPLNTTDFINGGDSSPRNRPALAQAFEENSTGARFIVVGNHLKSKGSACDTADAGDGQGNCNQARTNAMNTLLSWLLTDPTGTNDPDIIITGDLNSYAKEDPITALKGGGFTNLIESRIGAQGYSYAFAGQWGYLDHALASSSLNKQVVDVLEWHINADEPNALDYNTNFKSANQLTGLYGADVFRTSDHDPIIVGINLTAPSVTTRTGTSGANVLTGGAGQDRLIGLAGRDTLTGGGQRDEFVYNTVQDGIDTITDFTPYYDRIVLTGLLQSLGVTSSNPLASGHVVCAASGSNSVLSIDPDGSAGPALKRTLVQVNNLACANLAVSANFTF